MKNNWSKTTIISIPVIILVIFILWVTGIIGLWSYGMSYIVNNTKDFTDTKGCLLPSEYSISVNLADLKSNIGKELYNDGECKIYISWADNTGSLNSGGYRIFFRSSGPYSLSGAALVSGARHETVGNNSFTTYMTAKMTSKYKDKIYESSVFGISGINYKDGDDFSFYIFPSKAYQDGEISLNENDTVVLSIKNLYKNIWTKKGSVEDKPAASA
jgi:hypothetical protein